MMLSTNNQANTKMAITLLIILSNVVITNVVIRLSASLFRHRVTLGIVLTAGMIVQSTHENVAHASEHIRSDYEAELSRIDQNLQANIDVASQRPDSWLHLESVAKSYLERAQLTGEFDDYHASLTVMNKVFSISGERSGPVQTRATINYAVHRLPAVEKDLAKAESALLVDTPTMQAIQGIRADALLHTAQYALAKDAYDELESSAPSVTSATRLANYNAQLGHYQKAERWYEKAEQRVVGKSAHLRSWLKLQLGILDLARGQWVDAAAHYQEGLILFPGYWLLEEHIAEIDALMGRDQLAEEKYRDLIERTGSPVFMSALSEILALRSNEADQSEAVELKEKTHRVYEARIKIIPELMSGHALAHFLHSGDIRRTLELAQYNYQLRPGGEAAVQLVQAYTRLGQISRAAELLEVVLKSPYRSAELHATAGVVFRANGNSSRADEHNLLALAINPMAIDNIDWLHIPQP